MQDRDQLCSYPARFLEIVVSQQVLKLYHEGTLVNQYAISTAKNGLGEIANSYQTPRGWHQIAEKIGADAKPNTVFVARKPSGEIYHADLAKQNPDRDWILTRILRLRGLQRGKNSGGNVDSFNRYIYIHGVPDEYPMGIPLSHGCIRMHNDDVISLFNQIELADPLWIGEKEITATEKIMLTTLGEPHYG